MRYMTKDELLLLNKYSQKNNLIENDIFFVSKYESIFKQYNKRFIVIKQAKVIGAYDDYNLALKKTLQSNEKGTFSIKEYLEFPSQHVIIF